MYTKIRKILAEKEIPLYELDENDHQVMASWIHTHPDLNTPQGQLDNLIYRIYSFDYFYHYSDNGNAYRAWHNAEKEIDRNIADLTDRMLAIKLTAYRGPNRRNSMIADWPWLRDIYKNSSYKNLLDGGLSEIDAITHLTLVKWISSIVLNARVADYTNRLVYAKDIQLAEHLLKQGVSFDGGYTRLKSIAVTKDLHTQFALLISILDESELFINIKQYQKQWLEVLWFKGNRFLHIDGLYFMA